MPTPAVSRMVLQCTLLSQKHTLLLAGPLVPGSHYPTWLGWAVEGSLPHTPLRPSAAPLTSLLRGLGVDGLGVAGGGSAGAVVSDELCWGSRVPLVRAQVHLVCVSVPAVALWLLWGH